MKHENRSRKEPFCHLCLLFYKITYTLHTFPPKMDKFLKAVTKEVSTLFLKVLSASSFEFYRRRVQL
jgi:hypothetical protein